MQMLLATLGNHPSSKTTGIEWYRGETKGPQLCSSAITHQALGLSELFWHSFEHNGRQLNMSIIEHNRA